MFSGSRARRYENSNRDTGEDAASDDQLVNKMIQPAEQNIRQRPAFVQVELEQQLGRECKNDQERKQAAAPQGGP